MINYTKKIKVAESRPNIKNAIIMLYCPDFVEKTYSDGLWEFTTKVDNNSACMLANTKDDGISLWDGPLSIELNSNDVLILLNDGLNDYTYF